MALDITNQTKERRPIGFVLVGLVLLVVSGVFAYDVLRDRTSQTVSSLPSAYSYKINESVTSSVRYFQSSFYGDEPGARNTAYVSDLTNTVGAKLDYRYQANRDAELTYSYSAVASVAAKYITGSDEQNKNNVWSKEYVLVQPTSGSVSGKDVAVTPSVTIPFADYRKAIEQLKLALTLPVTADVSVVFTVRVSGTIDGTALNDIRVATVSMPLDQPLYTIARKFEKEDSKQLLTPQVKSIQDNTLTYERIAAIVIGILGLAALVYGMRRQIFKSAYQRELDKIFRYHDGIIIRASKPADLSGRKVVSVQGFDDMLNLEEELKIPIVASPAGTEATRFTIMRDDVVYVYTLGKVLIEEEEVTAVAEDEDKPERPAPRKKRLVQ